MATRSGSREQMNEAELGMPLPQPKRNCDRNFIMLGKVNSGKSTLSNLLMGSKEKIHFPENLRQEAIGKTTKVMMKYTEIESSFVFKDTCGILRFQITDLPGTNDPSFKDDKPCYHILQSIRKSRAQFSDTFLIVCDISGKLFSIEEIISILNISEVLSHSGYMFFHNAILVLTHADKYDDHHEEWLNELLKTESWACIQKLLDYMENRHVFINSLDQSERNRNSLIKTLFKLSKPTLKVAITGNNGFQSSELWDLLKFDDNTIIKKESEKVNFEYFFNSDTYNQFDKFNTEQPLEDDKLEKTIISKGISVMVVLISLEDCFTEEFYNIINQIPETFSIQKLENIKKIKKDPLWKYSFILFLSAIDDKNLVDKNVKQNNSLKEIVSRVNNRFTWVTRETKADECYKRLVNMIFKVNHDTLGTSFISNTIASKVSEDIKSSSSKKLVRVVNEKVSKPNRIQENLPCFKERASSSPCIRTNTSNWDKNVKPETTEAEIYFNPIETIENVGTPLEDWYKILVHGNNAAKSSRLFEILQLPYPNNLCPQAVQGLLEFYAYPDLDVFDPFKEPQIDDTLSKLISDSTGISLFIILICQTEIFSEDMKEMIINLPKNGQFPSEEYFWNHATILFSFEDNTENNHEEVSKSIKRNVGIEEVVKKAGNRYIWMSNSTTIDELRDSILSQCREVKLSEYQVQVQHNRCLLS